MYVPPGFATVTPYIFVNEAERFVDFLVDGLGGEGCCAIIDRTVASPTPRFESATPR
ncbi:hypothetical protein [Arhodomonas sp. AD133]|uniref:hypothetical protein n=1 Tax=Arhodomonas sp. AD133 TaxID=3415009 RepID=UPI003EB77D50